MPVLDINCVLHAIFEYADFARNRRRFARRRVVARHEISNHGCAFSFIHFRIASPHHLSIRTQNVRDATTDVHALTFNPRRRRRAHHDVPVHVGVQPAQSITFRIHQSITRRRRRIPSRQTQIPSQLKRLAYPTSHNVPDAHNAFVLPRHLSHPNRVRRRRIIHPKTNRCQSMIRHAHKIIRLHISNHFLNRPGVDNRISV
mmetsp:Transcript_3729/g.13457  ORF Transcript_3729/g.13457 Transcript_3729/m.13457 type:complete len:201 (-) Transcript_3729:397-999(-)